VTKRLREVRNLPCRSPSQPRAPWPHDVSGHGVPVVLLHGLTFDRRTSDPIVDRLGDDVLGIAVDLPGHGQSGGSGMPLERLASLLHRQLEGLGVDRPVVVGHSMSGGLAMLYAAEHPVRGAVSVDSPLDVRPFAALLRRLEPALRGPAFTETFERVFQASMGLDLLAADVRAAVLAGQRTDRDLVVAYWAQLLETDPEVLQARVDRATASIPVPLLTIFGRELAPSDRERPARVPDAECEVWDGLGHFLHLAAPDRFAQRLRAFVERCADAPVDARTPEASAG
jgi:pimeloyl-ACP methyl ester carboxylesterase